MIIYEYSYGNKKYSLTGNAYSVRYEFERPYGTIADGIPVLGSLGRSMQDAYYGDYCSSVINLCTSAAELLTLGSFSGSSVASTWVRSTKVGTTVLGHYPEYIQLAEGTGARTFQIPTKFWNKMTSAEQWAANQKFLDRMILRQDNIRLATPLNQVKPGSFYEKELNYLFNKGFNLSSDGKWLIK